MEQQTKKCKKCEQVLSITMFNKNNATRDGYDNACKACRSEQSKINRQKKRSLAQAATSTVLSTSLTRVLSDATDSLLTKTVKPEIQLKPVTRQLAGSNVTKTRVTQQGVKATFCLADFEDSHLFAELRRRGYAGELKYSKTVTI